MVQITLEGGSREQGRGGWYERGGDWLEDGVDMVKS